MISKDRTFIVVMHQQRLGERLTEELAFTKAFGKSCAYPSSRVTVIRESTGELWATFKNGRLEAN